MIIKDGWPLGVKGDFIMATIAYLGVYQNFHLLRFQVWY